MSVTISAVWAVILGVCGGVTTLAAAWKIVGPVIMRPVTEIRETLREIRAENQRQTEKLERLDADTADLLCGQLTREHDYYIALGFCPSADKARLDDIYTRYKARGRNHLADRYMDDILALPNALEDRR